MNTNFYSTEAFRVVHKIAHGEVSRDEGARRLRDLGKAMADTAASEGISAKNHEMACVSHSRFAQEHRKREKEALDGASLAWDLAVLADRR